jgi:hypothetical protein
VCRRRNREPVFFSNRALVYLKLNRFYESITDCTASIDRKPSIKVCSRARTSEALRTHDRLTIRVPLIPGVRPTGGCMGGAERVHPRR